MKNKYPIQTIDLRFQVDHTNPQKNQPIEEYRGATNNASLFIILLRHKEIKIISDGKKLLKLISYKMIVLILKPLLKKYDLKNDTMNESDLQRIHNYPIYLRESKIYADKGFVKIDNGSMGGSHWCCFIIKDNKSFYFDPFGGAPDKFLLNQLPKPKIYQNYKT